MFQSNRRFQAIEFLDRPVSEKLDIFRSFLFYGHVVPGFEENYITAKQPKRDQLCASIRAVTSKIYRMLITKLICIYNKNRHDSYPQFPRSPLVGTTVGKKNCYQRGKNTVSRRYRRAASCQPLQFFTKNNLRILKRLEWAFSSVSN